MIKMTVINKFSVEQCSWSHKSFFLSMCVIKYVLKVCHEVECVLFGDTFGNVIFQQNKFNP